MGERCIVCGKAIGSDDKIAKVTRGRMVAGQFQEGKLFGIAHDPCFDRAVESPQMVLDRVRKLAQPNKISKSK